MLVIICIFLPFSCQKNDLPQYKVIAESISDDRFGMDILIEKPISSTEIRLLNDAIRKQRGISTDSRIDIFLPNMRPDGDEWAEARTENGKIKITINKNLNIKNISL